MHKILFSILLLSNVNLFSLCQEDANGNKTLDLHTTIARDSHNNEQKAKGSYLLSKEIILLKIEEIIDVFKKNPLSVIAPVAIAAAFVYYIYNYTPSHSIKLRPEIDNLNQACLWGNIEATKRYLQQTLNPSKISEALTYLINGVPLCNLNMHHVANDIAHRTEIFRLLQEVTPQGKNLMEVQFNNKTPKTLLLEVCKEYCAQNDLDTTCQRYKEFITLLNGYL